MTKRKIVAIGGGELRLLQTEEIDRRIIELTGKTKPIALFIPTASGDAEGYIDNFHKTYGQHYGCQTKILKLIQDPPSLESITDLVLNSDLIYVGGGNTYRMMKIWRRMQLDSILTEAASRGIVLSGLSAGAICWFKYGHSDSRSFSSNSEWDYIRVSGLGLINLTFCPHYHIEKRETSFTNMIVRKGGIGLACDNSAAIEIIGDEYRILTSMSTARAYKLYKHKGDSVISELQPQTEYTPLSKLLTRGQIDQ